MNVLHGQTRLREGPLGPPHSLLARTREPCLHPRPGPQGPESVGPCHTMNAALRTRVPRSGVRGFPRSHG